jgi:HK97 family phage major capsid protein
MTLQALREQRTKVVAGMRAVLVTAGDEKRDLTDEEKAKYDALKIENEKLLSAIAREEEVAAAEAHLAKSAGAVAANARPGNGKGPEAKTEFESLGEFLHAVRFTPSDQRLHFQPLKRDDDMRAEQRMDVGISGGFAIPVTFRAQLLSVTPMAAVVRPRATVIPAGDPPDGVVLIPALDQSAATNMYGGVVVSWIGEGGPKPDTSANIRQISLQPQEVAGTVKFTDKLLRNWQAAGPLITQLVRGAITAAEDVAFLTGNGVNKPMGLLNASAAILVNRVTPNTITYADVLAMEETLFGDDPSVFWVCSKRARTWLRKLQNPAGYYIWQEDAQAKIPPTLLGHDVCISDRVPTLGTQGDLMLIDGSKYIIKDGSGPFVAFSDQVYFTTNETVMKAFWNVDGQPWVKNPIMTENGELQTPFVILN